MRQIALVVVAFAVIAGTAVAAVIPPGAIVHYTMDTVDTSGSTILDTSGSATVHNGAMSGTGVVSHAGGVFGQSVVFTTTNSDSVNIPNHPEINTSAVTDRTVAMWFKADGTSLRQVLFEEGGGTHGLNMYIYNDDLYVGMWRDTGATETYLSTPVDAGVWHHAAFVLDSSSTFTGYLDGIAFDTGVGATVPAYANENFIGGRNGNSDTRFETGTGSGQGANSNAFGGMLDQFVLYNRALTDQEILGLSVIPEPTTLLIWSLLAGLGVGLGWRRRK